MKIIRLFACFLFLFLSTFAQSSNITKICFARGGFVYVMDMKTKQTKRVVKGSDPNISPDGKQIAFTFSANAATPSRIVKVIDLETNKERDFKGLAKFIHYGAIWSPDGKRLAVHVFKEAGQKYNWEVAIVNPESGEWRFLTDTIPHDGAYLSSWTAGGQSIVCHDLNFIYEVDLNGKVVRRFTMGDVTKDNSISSATRFVFSPDGKMLLFDADLSDEIGALFVYYIEDDTLRRITPNTISATDPKWLPSGKEILFSGRQIGKGRQIPQKLFKISLAGNTLEAIITNADQGSFAVGK
jgi:Tol biopolymer transport system component